MRVLLAAASVAALVTLAPAMAQAQTAPNTGAYVNLGYSFVDAGGSVNFGALGARVGYRFNNWLGAEGEGAFGVDSDKVTVGTTSVKVELKHEFAGYLVGFVPVGTNTDVLARIGYGTTKISASASGVGASGSDESFNFGVGAQHHWDGVNGVRVDFTRQEFNDSGHANVWSVAYSRRF